MGEPASRPDEEALVAFASEALEEALGRETLKSEQYRYTLLAATFAGLAAIFTLAWPIFAGELQRIFHGRLRPWVVVSGLLLLAAYEFLMRTAAGRAIGERRAPSPAARYANALFETALPTAALIFAGQIFDPVLALLSPPSFLYFIVIALSALRLDRKLSLFTGASAAAQYFTLALLAIRRPEAAQLEPFLTALPHHLGKAIMMLATGAITGMVGDGIRRHLRDSLATVAERNRIVDLFGQHVSAAVVDKLLSQRGEPGGELRHVCVMFLDIRDFTAFSEKRRPEEVVAYLNGLWGFMIEIVNAHGGIINKFLGDGFMAVFGAPVSDGHDSRNAVAAARAILERIDAEGAAGRFPPTRVGIGLHAGEAVTGNVGSPRRKEYTIIGDVVNLAARLEQLTKQHGARLLVSGAVYAEVKESAAGAVPLGPLAVKGRGEAVEVWRLA